MAEIEGTLVEEIYLENTTTRHAFYHAKIMKNGLKYNVVVLWGKLGTSGQVAVKGRHSSLDNARTKMHTIVEEKKLRHYKETQLKKMTSKPSTSTKKIDHTMIRFADLE